MPSAIPEISTSTNRRSSLTAAISSSYENPNPSNTALKGKVGSFNLKSEKYEIFLSLGLDSL